MALSTSDLSDLQDMLQPGDRATVARRLKHKYSSAYVSMVVDPENPRYNKEIIDEMLRMLLKRTRLVAIQHQRIMQLKARSN